MRFGGNESFKLAIYTFYLEIFLFYKLPNEIKIKTHYNRPCKELSA